ncbi:MAG: hypothetical protein GY863_00120 [bacterium]|nr:hypothetical protein [bacterium]
MKLLTRAEELVLLSVWHLKEKAYSVHIREMLMKTTGEYWSFGAVYMPLDRLVKKSYLESYLADPTPERGGRSKRIYQFTDDGKKALIEVFKIHEAMWQGIPEILLGKIK